MESKPVECTVMCLQCVRIARSKHVRQEGHGAHYHWFLVECHGKRRLVEIVISNHEKHPKRFWDDLPDVFEDPKEQAERTRQVNRENAELIDILESLT